MAVALPTALSFHVLAGIDADDDVTAPRVPGARWLAGIDAVWGDDGWPRPDPSLRLWLGFWDDTAAAVDAVAHADAWLPGRAAAEGHWSIALAPYLSRGDVDWHGATGPVCAPAPGRPAADAPVATITSFGVPTDRATFAAFGQRVHAVRATLRASPGLLAEFELTVVEPALRDPLTFTLWRCEADAMAFAYRQAPHRPALDWAKEASAFRRSSFTRAQPLAESGARLPLRAG